MSGNQQAHRTWFSLAPDLSRHFKTNQGAQAVTVKSVGCMEMWRHHFIQSIDESVHPLEGRFR
jgi:hypothetical protein